MRIKGLDGLRALAALSVFGFHAGGWVPGGWLGVDVFFVISGFVITRSLLSDQSLIRFYVRRALRLYPALIVMCLFFVVAQSVSWKDWLPALTYTANFTRLLYFFPTVFGHTWSLAIEEQFYLVWPIAMIFILRTKNPVVWVVSLALIFCTWRLYLLQNDASNWRLYNMPDTRADALMIGACLAFVNLKPLGRAWPIGGPFLLWSLLSLIITDEGLFVWGLPAVALASATIIAKITSDQNSLLTRLLHTKALRGLGVISYAFYVWHYPILWFYHSQGVLFCLFASILAAYLSWVLVERPIKEYRNFALSLPIHPASKT